jgi:HSP20 family molecular chaperone IbpA
MFGSHSITLSVPETRTYLESISNTNYPPHNILKTKEGYRLEMAVAGFKRNEVKVYTEQGKLFIEGNKEDFETSEYIHRGLAFRRFNRVWQMPTDLVITGVNHIDGIIYIDFNKVIPEEQRRKDYL